ncbi:MAG: FAD-binding oxidoreductase [Alphaproteobacteria bacterium]|nr:FAD-binding oxidoreductase [Alphaproteobacteria bacterium]
MNTSRSILPKGLLPEGFLDALDRITGPRGWSANADAIAPHARESWGIGRGQTPLLLKPASVDEVSALLSLCHEHRVQIVPQGGNTGLVWAGIPDDSGRLVVLSLSRLNRVRKIDPIGDTMTVEAGVVLERAQEAADDVDRLFPLALGAQGTCQIGGNLSTNAGGVNVLRYGMARDLVLGLEVVLADGRVWNGLKALRKDNTGYDLKQLFVGAEGTLGVITAAVLRLFPKPRETNTAWLAVPSPQKAVELFAFCRERLGDAISSFELMGDLVVQRVIDYLPDGRQPLRTATPWHVLIEVAWSLDDGLLDRLEHVLADAMRQGLVTDGTVAASEAQRKALWLIRENPTDAFAQAGVVLRHDVSVPVADVPALIEHGSDLFQKKIPGVQVVAFGHIGDGNIHFNLLQPEAMEGAAFRAMKDDVQTEVFDLVERLGGSISAEHGIGRLKRDDLAARKPALDLDLMHRLKNALDPHHILNPGAIL